MNNIYFFLKTFFLFYLLFSNSYSEGLFSKNNATFLKAEKAFIVSVEQESEDLLLINFNVAKGYYLYKDQIKIILDNKEINNINFPESKIKEDEFFGKSEIYDSSFILKINIENNSNLVNVYYQGCANKGLCYPPIRKNFDLGGKLKTDFSDQEKISESELIYGKISSNNVITNILLFIGFGLLLSFTPCVLPMVPILSSLILKSNNENSNKPFLLSFYYVLGLCVLYFLVGLFIGYSSDIYNIQSIFQDPLYLIFFILILIVLSLSMFGLYEIKIANSFQRLVTNFSNRIRIGGYGGSFIMGFFSALIVGPCVAPPLAGIFIYITSENPGAAVTGLLFLSLAIGMSLPLLFYGTFMGKIIPKTGKWMKYINYLIGVLLLIVAITFIDRLVPVLNVSNNDSSLVFKKIKNVGELNRFLNTESDKIVFLDVYADWCIECKLMEQKTFKNINVETLLKELNLIKIDVTNNSKEDIALLKYLNVLGPPAYKFYDREGIEIKGYSIQGYMNAEKFQKHLEEIISIDLN